MTTFYKNYISLCAQKKKSASAVAVEVGLSRTSPNGWKKGKNPSDINLEKIADYFGVTVDYLLTDHSGQKENPTEIPGEVNTDNISELLEKMTTPDLINLLGEITETLKRRDEK